MHRPAAILFDYGDTLVTTDPPYVERIRRALKTLGYPRSPAEMDHAFLTADHETSVLALEWEGEMDRRRFDAVFFQTMMGLLAIEVDDLAAFARDMGRAMSEFDVAYLTRAEVPETLDALTQREIPLAVLSNNDGRTVQKCEAAGIDAHFVHIIDSTQEGLSKPDPRLFHRAVERMGVAAESVLHVGDLFGCDVLGARAAGVPVVWYNHRAFRPVSPVADEVSEVRSLLDILKLWED